MIDGIPQVHFARSQGANIAYQVFGSGPPVVAIPPAAQNIELGWEWPAIRAMLERFASFSRYLHFDKRGTGASDRAVPVPEMDQRVDDLRAVMDHAGIERAHLFGTSEGGPMTLMFAATYPDRVAGLILEGSGARLGDVERPMDPERRAAMLRWVEGWGKPGSTTADLFAPSLAGDTTYRTWHERYERHAATQDGLMQLLQLNAHMDARGVLHRIDAPVLILHRTDDAVVPVEFARELAAGLPNARLLERPGCDHYTYAGGDVEDVLTEIERFVTGRTIERVPRRTGRVEVEALGRFRVLVDGTEIAPAEWGSRRARQLLKRLVVARGWPVTRDELTDMLWPDEDDERVLRPRLSVQLSAVRRVLGGGVIADRSSIRLDLDTVDVDLARFHDLNDDTAIVEAYGGELLPDDRYESWTDGARAAAHMHFLAAADRLLADMAGEHDEVVRLAATVLAVDPFHDGAHRALITAHEGAGRAAAAADARRTYTDRLVELGVDTTDIADLD